MKCAVLALLAWALTCGSASASTVTLTPVNLGSRLDLIAAPGERNDVQIDPGEQPRTVRVRDAAGLTPVAPCVAEDAQTATCPTTLFLHIELRDGDDRLTGTLRQYATVAGGDGNDELRWSSSGRIDGGPGDDVLSGQEVDGGPGADVLQGTKLLYGARTEGIGVDLVSGVAGAPGEQDRVLPGVRSVQTGSGPDVVQMADIAVEAVTGAGDDTVIAGPGGSHVNAGPGNDRLNGGAGNDELFGQEGADVIDGGPGADRLDGGAGKDHIAARDGQRERVDCAEAFPSGPLAGDIAVLDADDSQRLCEFVERSGPPRIELVAALGYSAPRRVLVSCPPRARPQACAGTVRVRGDRARPFAVKPGKRARLLVRPRVGSDLAFSVTIALRSGRTLRAVLETVSGAQQVPR